MQKIWYLKIVPALKGIGLNVGIIANFMDSNDIENG